MRLRLADWHALSLARRGYLVHVRTDPVCAYYRPPRPGTRLDRASRGISCPRCMADRHPLTG